MHTNTFVSVLGMVASASAHIVMSEPKGWEVNNSPLAKDGSDFPCKAVSYDSSVQAVKMSKGDQQTMRFKGSAVHGGGSCQVSLTTDTEPTKDSVWKVIKSFEGGCPAKGQEGNYGENADMELPDKYGFEIPDDVPAGKYTLAWTWFNKVGNREMYMNCAPIEAEGSGGSESDFQALPDMFTANIYGEGKCETKEGDLEFPNAGKLLEKLGVSSLIPFSNDGCPSGGQYSEGPSGGSDGGSSSGGAESSPVESGAAESGASETGAYESGAAESSAPAESGGPLAGGIFAPIDGAADAAPTEAPAAAEPSAAEPSAAESSAPAGSESASPTESGPAYDEGSALPSQAAPANSQQESGSSTPSASAGSSGGHEAGEACTTDGFWNCIDGNSFQRCGSGIWSAVQQLSEGTECTPGETENIQMTRKRGMTRFGAKFFL